MKNDKKEKKKNKKGEKRILEIWKMKEQIKKWAGGKKNEGK